MDINDKNFNEIIKWSPIKSLTQEFSNLNEQYFYCSDLYENDKDLILEIAISNLDKESIEIYILDNNISIKGLILSSQNTSENRYFQKEIKRGLIELNYNIPITIDPDNTLASYNNGILEITMKKHYSNMEKRIQINK